MTTHTFAKSETVMRINSGKVNGQTGVIVELSKQWPPRYRVLWNHSNIRTWIKETCLQKL